MRSPTAASGECEPHSDSQAKRSELRRGAPAKKKRQHTGHRDSEPERAESGVVVKVYPTARIRIKAALRLFAWVLHRGVCVKKEKRATLLPSFLLVHLQGFRTHVCAKMKL